MKTKEQMNTAYKSGKANLLLIVLFTTVNLVFQFIGTNGYFLFSATAPQIAMAFSRDASGELNYAIFLLGAIAPLVLYMVCWLRADKKPVWMLLATILFGIDTLLLGGLIVLSGEGVFPFLMDILFHGAAMVLLVRGAVAARKLFRLPEEEREALISLPEDPMAAAGALETPEVDAAEPETRLEPLRAAKARRKPVLTAEYRGMRLGVTFDDALMELIVDGQVYAEAATKGAVRALALSAGKNGAVLGCRVDVRGVTRSVTLTGDGQELATKKLA